MAGLSRVVDQMIGGSLQQQLVANAGFGINTYHVGKNPALSGGLTSDAPFALVAGVQAGSDYLTSAGKFLHLIVDITAITATGTVTVTILGVDPISGKTYTILASAALGAVATTVLRVGPALTATGGLVANDIVPLYWGVQVVVATAAPMTFSIAAMQMP